MSNIVDFSTAVNSAIQAGSAIEGTAVRVLADNGSEIGQAVAQNVAAGGGTGATVYTLTQAGAGGANVATGVSLLALELPTTVAAIAPCLGVVAGIGLYALAPDFWTKLSNSLVAAGQTIGGKIISFWDGENTYYNGETIEIIKNSLLELGYFDAGGVIDYGASDFTGISLAFPFTPKLGNWGIQTIGNCYTYGLANSVKQIILYSASKNTYYYICADNAVSYGRINYINGGYDSLSLNDSYTHDGKTVYYEYVNFTNKSVNDRNTAIGYGVPLVSGNYDSVLDIPKIAWVMLYGSAETNPVIQDGATLPTTSPFEQTFPNWRYYQYIQTLPDPDELPKIYPVKYPSINPNPYPLQEPSQNPDPEEVPVIYPQIIPDFELPDPLPNDDPQPEPDPDPDPQPEPDPITDPETETPTDPDPTDPNPDPTPSAPIVIPSLPATVSSNKLFTVYNPSAANLDSLGGYLWDGSIIAAIRDIWQEPLDGLISLIQVFVTPTTGGNHNIILGFLDSGVSAPVVSSQFVTVDCGSVTINEDKQNATDYAPYTSIHLYLPFIGFVELDTNEVMNSEISVKYKVDVYTGTCLAQVSVDRAADMPDDPILYTYSGNCSQQIPLTSGNATGMLSALIGGITAGLSVASGGGLGIMAGAQLLGNSLTHEMFHVNHSGNLSANAGIMGQKKPYIIIGRRHGYDANNYSHYYGYPVNKTVVLGNHTGYAQVKKCLLQTTATKPEYDEILSLLENGVIL